jgi:hypothetical protein
MNPRAMCTSTAGCARVGLLSVAAAASVWNAQVTPADETPFHRLVLTVTWRAIDRNGLPDPCAVRMIDGSMNTGMPYPPAADVKSAIARYSSHAWTALRSSSERNGCGCVTSFIHASR